MSRVETIESQVKELFPDELSTFREWFACPRRRSRLWSDCWRPWSILWPPLCAMRP